MDILITIIPVFLLLFSIYQIASLAGLFSEKSGVANIAIEGNMVLSATIFSILLKFLYRDTAMDESLCLFISIIITCVISSFYMMILSICTNRYLADHVIVGTGMNLLAPALCLLLWIVTINSEWGLDGIKGTISMGSEFTNWNVNLASGDTVNKLDLWFPIASIVIAIISGFYLNKTKSGLRLRSSGENPFSLETSGVSVSKTRRNALIIAGLLSGLAGSMYVVYNPAFKFTVTGYGFIAIAILIMSGYRVLWTTLWSVVFALFFSIFSNWFSIAPMSAIPSDLMMALPFLVPIIGLLIFKKQGVPKAVGTNFKKDQR